MHDLLTDPLIGVRTPEGERRVSLPDLLAALSAGAVDGFTGLRAHQADPCHVFLVQLAASIQARRRTERLPTDAAYWRDGLLDLADGKASAWELVVNDVTQPAFLQHPWRSWEEAKDYGVKASRRKTGSDPNLATLHELDVLDNSDISMAATPDELDVLVTSKNHDVKIARMGAELAEAWLFALITLQTTSGYLGREKYGIVRMKKGGSRPIVAWMNDRHPSARFIDETQALYKMRNEVCQKYRYAPRGVVLTWLTPWDRKDHQFLMIDQTPLEPWFIEACRPIRLRALKDGRLIALGATSKARQIGPDTLNKGNIGDPWTPIDKKDFTALNITAKGFTPRILVNLIFRQGFELTPLQEPKPGEGVGWFVASCLVRGEGTTKGYHRVEIPIPPPVRAAMRQPQRHDTLAHLAIGMLNDADIVSKALRVSLSVLTRGGNDKADSKRANRDKTLSDSAKKWIDAVDQLYAKRWETHYFPTLWRGAAEDHEVVRGDWWQQLVNAAQDLLDEAIQRLPLPTNRSWRAVTKAQDILHSKLEKSKLPLPAHTRSEDADSMEDTTV